MNAKDDRVIGFIRDYTEAQGYPPTIQDICKAVGVKSSATMHTRLRRLKHEGQVTWDEGKVRTLKVKG